MQRDKNLKSKSANLQLLQKGLSDFEIYNKTSSWPESPRCLMNYEQTKELLISAMQDQNYAADTQNTVY